MTGGTPPPRPLSGNYGPSSHQVGSFQSAGPGLPLVLLSSGGETSALRWWRKLIEGVLHFNMMLLQSELNTTDQTMGTVKL